MCGCDYTDVFSMFVLCLQSYFYFLSKYKYSIVIHEPFRKFILEKYILQ